MSSKNVVLDGENLKIEDLQSLIDDPSVIVTIANKAWQRIKKSKDFLDKQIDTDRVIYGVNTGFGPMASYIIGKEQLLHLQKNLIRSHAVGMGEAIPENYVLAGMVVRLNTLVKGYSGVSKGLIEQLQAFINRRIIPIIPEHGAVGTSGDLVQLSHIALALLGEGEVVYKGKRESAAAVLKKNELTPLSLGPREGLALINGTAVMTGIATLLWDKMGRSLSVAMRLGALALELVNGFEDSLDDKLHRLRPHPGQIQVAKILRELLFSSGRLRNRDQLTVKGNGEDVQLVSEEIQQVYSLRCVAQILGPVFDSWCSAKKTIEIELNAVTDNPIVDWEEKKFIHGGNFHGEYIAAVVDEMKIALIKLMMLSERRTNFFLNARLNQTFPPFMNLKKPGLTLGLQGLQFVATSTTSQSQSLAFPHRIHSISTNGDNQDVVSLGTDAALLMAKVVDNAYIVQTIELIVLAQGLDFVNDQDNFSKSSREIVKELREILPAVIEDRVLITELPRVLDFVKGMELIDLG